MKDTKQSPPACCDPVVELTGPAAEAARLAWAEDARERFEALYERLPSWEVPFPQPVFVELAEAGRIASPVLDAGCGTGENALFLAARGLDVWGIDLAAPAIGMARSKAVRRGLPAARFLLGDALDLGALGMRFATVIDSGLFHALTDGERALYCRSLEQALQPGGLLHILGYSAAQPGDTGPRRLARDEFFTTFTPPWQVLEVVEARLQNNIHPGGAQAWRASLQLR